MDKEEFLGQLRKRLSRKMKSERVDELVEYYSDYIDKRKQEGLLESEVLDELGSPLLIAKTILEAGNENTSVETEPLSERTDVDSYEKFGNNKWKWILGLVIALFVLGIVVKIVGAIVSVLLPILLPVALVFIAIYVAKHKDHFIS